MELERVVRVQSCKALKANLKALNFLLTAMGRQLKDLKASIFVSVKILLVASKRKNLKRL